MITILSALLSLLSFRARSRASLELGLVALRHQVSVNAMVLVKPATVVHWHRSGFQLYWRRRSRRLRRPRTGAEIRDLVRRMTLANPLWGAPRIHGELLKLGIEVSQPTVGRYLPWQPKAPSPTWRSFLHNHLTNIAVIDMFVVATATVSDIMDSLQERIAHLLTRPVGRPPNEVRRFCANFSYQAGSWTKPRRAVAKVEWHPGELYPRVGFIVPNMARRAENVVAFYNKHGTCE